MRISFGRPWRLAAAVLVAACSTQALAPRAVLLEGDQTSAKVGFSGDLDAATAIARRHCAGYERIARFVDATTDTAYFDCVVR